MSKKTQPEFVPPSSETKPQSADASSETAGAAPPEASATGSAPPTAAGMEADLERFRDLAMRRQATWKIIQTAAREKGLRQYANCAFAIGSSPAIISERGLIAHAAIRAARPILTVLEMARVR